MFSRETESIGFNKEIYLKELAHRLGRGQLGEDSGRSCNPEGSLLSQEECVFQRQSKGSELAGLLSAYARSDICSQALQLVGCGPPILGYGEQSILLKNLLT